MIVLEGMPGAGKTSALGALLAADPPRAVVFPEAAASGDAPLTRTAVPPKSRTSEVPDIDRTAGGAPLAALLDEDADRLALAGRLAGRGLLCVSDRCYAGTLAYRYARAATGRDDPAALTAARAEVNRRGLPSLHAGTTLLVLHLSPAASLNRRHAAPTAVRREWGEWFDPAFLRAYARFWDRTDWWAPPGATVRHVDASSPHRLRVLLAAATGIDPVPPPVSTALACPASCGAPRSPVVRLRGADVQLAARSLHYLRPGGPVACLRRAADVAACWTG